MSLFPNGFIACEEDFNSFTAKTTLSNAERWLNSWPFQSQMYYCPKGSGKTTLLRYFLSEDKRKQLALEKKLLFKDCPLSPSFLRNDADVFCCLINAITDSVSVLDREEREWFKAAFRAEAAKDEYVGYRQNRDKAFELLKNDTEILKEKGYFVVLIIDDFHLLTCSTICATDTFNNMAHLDQLKLIGYIILSDYHVSIGSEEYRLSEFERVIQSFNSLPKLTSSERRNKKRIELLCVKVREAIRRQQEIEELEPKEMFDIPDEELKLIIDLTGGIPGMIQHATDAYYSARLARGGEPLLPNEFWNVVFEGCKPLMREWVHYLKDTAPWETLRIIYDNREVTNTMSLERKVDKSSALTDTGLLYIDTVSRKYVFACPLFERFIAEELQRPYHISSDVEKLLEKVGNKDGTTINISIDQSVDKSTNNTLKIENSVIAPGLTASGILQLLNAEGTADFLGDARANYAFALKKQFSSIQRTALPQPSSGQSEDEIYWQIQQDVAFDEFGSQIVQDVNVDDNQDLIDVTPEELETLDKRFEEARSRNVRAALTDNLLNTLSERCQFYLKLSVVVEDALSFISMDDYSPQLVLYGKALEQSLRDHFFDLFHSDSTISAYVFGKRKDDSFSNVLKEKSFISSYQFVIDKQAPYLSQLAVNHNIRFQDHVLTKQWWRTLKDEIHEARLIRNMADHAGNVSPMKENVDEMFSYLVGSSESKGILMKSTVGKDLMNILSTGDSSIGELLDKDSCDMTITEIKEGGQIRGIIDDCSITVRVSKRQVQKFLMNNPDVHFEREMNISVKLSEYVNDDFGDYFRAKILSD